MLSYCQPGALSPSHSKPIIQAHGLSTATLHGMLPPGSPSRYWRGQKLHWPYWTPTAKGWRRLTESAKTGTSGFQTQRTFGIPSSARLASRMILGFKENLCSSPAPGEYSTKSAFFLKLAIGTSHWLKMKSCLFVGELISGQEVSFD